MKQTINSYIHTFPTEVQLLLEQLRTAIKKAAPQASETINYAMPTFVLEGNLVHFAAYKQHIGFYPGPSGLKAFEQEVQNYKNSKGAVQFPLNKKLPLTLVTKIVKFRVKENIEKALKKNLKTCKQGHSFYKSSDCPTCPVCEKERKPTGVFLALLAAPARRALENAGIKTLKALSNCSEQKIIQLHGMGKSSLPILKAALKAEGLSFKKE